MSISLTDFMMGMYDKKSSPERLFNNFSYNNEIFLQLYENIPKDFKKEHINAVVVDFLLRNKMEDKRYMDLYSDYMNVFTEKQKMKLRVLNEDNKLVLHLFDKPSLTPDVLWSEIKFLKNTHLSWDASKNDAITNLVVKKIEENIDIIMKQKLKRTGNYVGFIANIIKSDGFLIDHKIKILTALKVDNSVLESQVDGNFLFQYFKYTELDSMFTPNGQLVAKFLKDVDYLNCSNYREHFTDKAFRNISDAVYNGLKIVDGPLLTVSESVNRFIEEAPDALVKIMKGFGFVDSGKSLDKVYSIISEDLKGKVGTRANLDGVDYTEALNMVTSEYEGYKLNAVMKSSDKKNKGSLKI